MSKCRHSMVLTLLVFLTVCGSVNAEAKHSPMDLPCPSTGALWAKFTIVKVVDESTLEVKYPASVFSATNPEDKEVDAYYIEKKGLKGTFKIYVNSSKELAEGKTYVFIRCPSAVFQKVGGEIDPNDES